MCVNRGYIKPFSGQGQGGQGGNWQTGSQWGNGQNGGQQSGGSWQSGSQWQSGQGKFFYSKFYSIFLKDFRLVTAFFSAFREGLVPKLRNVSRIIFKFILFFHY